MFEITIVGDFWNSDHQIPFAGTEAWMLDNLLAQVGISRKECFQTSVFNFSERWVESLCGKRPEGIPNQPPILPGKYIRNEFAGELERFYHEIADANSNVIIALGSIAAWALTGAKGIKAVRGVTTLTAEPATAKIGRPVKVVPTYEPAAISRQWSLRPVVLSDLDKARRQAGFRKLNRPSRKIWIRPTLDDIRRYEQEHILGAEKLACDIETRQEQITCIGFSPSADSAIVIPFFGESGKNYWQTAAEEIAAWEYVRRWLATYPTVYQNGVYDMTFLWKYYGIPAAKTAGDTMLLHHAMQIKMEKGLGFLGSIYTDEASWKFMSKGNTTHD